MSGELIVALIAVIVSGFVSVVNLGFSLWTSTKEREQRLREQQYEHDERYRIELYGKRLAVHQDAYNWLMQLIEPLQRACELTSGDRDLPEGFILHKLYSEAREWWDGNCLYLDEASQRHIIDFVELAGEFLEGPPAPERSRVYAQYREALRAVQEGIGMKHLEQAERADA